MLKSPARLDRLLRRSGLVPEASAPMVQLTRRTGPSSFTTASIEAVFSEETDRPGDWDSFIRLHCNCIERSFLSYGFLLLSFPSGVDHEK
jgi:hypothetical protein